MCLLFFAFLARLLWKDSPACPCIQTDLWWSKQECSSQIKSGEMIFTCIYLHLSLQSSGKLGCYCPSLFTVCLKIVCFSRLLVKFPELNYQLKIKVCIDKWVCVLSRTFRLGEERWPWCFTDFNLIFQGIWRRGFNSRVRLQKHNVFVVCGRVRAGFFEETPLTFLGHGSLISSAPTLKLWTWKNQTMAACQQSLNTWWVMTVVWLTLI